MIQPSHPPQPSREPFEKAYKVGPVLGKGGFGIVYAGVRNRDGLQVAIKHIAKAKIKDWGQVSLLAFVQFIKCSYGKILIYESYDSENWEGSKANYRRSFETYKNVYKCL